MEAKDVKKISVVYQVEYTNRIVKLSEVDPRNQLTFDKWKNMSVRSVGKMSVLIMDGILSVEDLREFFKKHPLETRVKPFKYDDVDFVHFTKKSSELLMILLVYPHGCCSFRERFSVAKEIRESL